MHKQERLADREISHLARILTKCIDIDEMDDILLQLGINREMDIVTAGGSSISAVFRKILIGINQRNQIADFLKIAVNIRRYDDDLIEFKNKYDRSCQPTLHEKVSPRPLERTVNHLNTVIKKPKWWREQMKGIEGCICRIEVRGKGDPYTGTGFLVGSDMVLTNYHVIERIIGDPLASNCVTLRFDYSILEDGVTPSIGIEYYLYKTNWLIDYSEYSELESLIDAKGEEPRLDQLDYALLCIANMPGTEVTHYSLDSSGEPVSSTDKRKSFTRGWIQIPESYDIKINTPLHILHHPDGEALELALNTSAVIDINKNKTRIRYSTNTENGSSGGACFNQSWQLIALHQGSDPNYEKDHEPQFNQGIPFTTILDLLSKKGYRDYLNRTEPYFLNRLERDRPTAFPYIRKLYEQIINLDKMKRDHFLEWIGNLCAPHTIVPHFFNNHGYWLTLVLSWHICHLGGKMQNQPLENHELLPLEPSNAPFRGLDEKVTSQHAALYFKDRAELFSQRIEFLKSCQAKWQHLQVGHSVITNTHTCLRSIGAELDLTLSFFYSYTLSNQWLPEEVRIDYGVKYKYDRLKQRIEKLISIFEAMNINLSVRSREDVLSEIGLTYNELIFQSERYISWASDFSHQAQSFDSV